MRTNLVGLCRDRIAVSPFSNLSVAAWLYGGGQVVGQAHKPDYAEEIQARGSILLSAKPEDFVEKRFSLDSMDRPDVLDLSKQQQLEEQRMPYNPHLMHAYENGQLPRATLLACNPNELGAYATEIVELWERFVDDGILTTTTTAEEVEECFPLFAPACNGVVMGLFSGRMRGEILNSEKIMNIILSIGGEEGYAVQLAMLSTLLRIGPYQAAQRYTNDAGELVYRPMGIDHLEVAGGTLGMRTMVAEMINENHGIYRRWMGLPQEDFATRLIVNAQLMDYLKAMLTININAYAIVLSMQGGEFVPVTMGQMAEKYATEMKEYSHTVHDIAVKSGFNALDGINFEDEYDSVLKTLLKNHEHPTSSVSAVAQALEAGNLSPELGFNERALINPLIAQARRLGMIREVGGAVAVLTELRDNVIRTLQKLAA